MSIEQYLYIQYNTVHMFIYESYFINLIWQDPQHCAKRCQSKVHDNTHTLLAMRNISATIFIIINTVMVVIIISSQAIS